MVVSWWFLQDHNHTCLRPICGLRLQHLHTLKQLPQPTKELAANSLPHDQYPARLGCGLVPTAFRILWGTPTIHDHPPMDCSNPKVKMSPLQPLVSNPVGGETPVQLRKSWLRLSFRWEPVAFGVVWSRKVEVVQQTQVRRLPTRNS